LSRASSAWSIGYCIYIISFFCLLDYFRFYPRTDYGINLEPERASVRLQTKPTEEDLKNIKEQMSEAIDLKESVF
jgi:hypothetical protein